MIVKNLDHLNYLSQKVANQLKSSDNIYLIGEIGVGKTTFIRYLINYLQEKKGEKITEVLSPTFNLLHEYDLKKLKIMHYDLFRLKDEKELEQLDIFSENQNTVNIIEWPNLINNPLLEKLEIHINYVKNYNEREVSFIGSGKWQNFDGL